MGAVSLLVAVPVSEADVAGFVCSTFGLWAAMMAGACLAIGEGAAAHGAPVAVGLGEFQPCGRQAERVEASRPPRAF